MISYVLLYPVSHPWLSHNTVWIIFLIALLDIWTHHYSMRSLTLLQASVYYHQFPILAAVATLNIRLVAIFNHLLTLWMLDASHFIVALSITLSFGNADAKVLFKVMHDCLYLAYLGFAVLCLENIVWVGLLLNHIPVKVEFEFIFLRYLLFNRYL